MDATPQMGGGTPFWCMNHLSQTERTTWNCQNKGTSWKNLQTAEELYEHRAACKSRNRHCVVVCLISTSVWAQGAGTAPGLHSSPWGMGMSQPLPSAAGTADPTAVCRHSKVTHKSTRGLVQTTARVGKNCLDEDKEVISQLVQKWNGLLQSSHLQGLCVPHQAYLLLLGATPCT